MRTTVWHFARFAWAGDGPVRLLANGRGGGREALACYGLPQADTGATLLRFVEGRPVSRATEDDVGRLRERFAAEGKRLFVLVWDNASWLASKRVRRWIGQGIGPVAPSRKLAPRPPQSASLPSPP
jgi:hypothetical protein